MKKQSFSEKVIPLLMIPGIFVTDFFIKEYIEQYGGRIAGKKIFREKIRLKKHHNTGMAMDILEHRTGWVLAVSSILVTILSFFMALLMPKQGKWLMKYGLGFLLGGAAGNLYDRAVRHYVVDYFSFETGISWIDRIIFNLSDLCIFVGVLLLAAGEMLDGRKDS